MSKPIIFTGPSIPAILAGTKTMTRRVIPLDKQAAALARPEHSPYGQVGDPLRVKTAHYRAFKGTPNDQIYDEWTKTIRWKDGRTITNCVPVLNLLADSSRRWTKVSPYFMPNWAIIIKPEITSLGVERLQDISGKDKDVRREGIRGDSYLEELGCTKDEPMSARIYFSDRWDSINAKRGYSWDSNPWVWVIGFEMIKEPEQC